MTTTNPATEPIPKKPKTKKRSDQSLKLKYEKEIVRLKSEFHLKANQKASFEFTMDEVAFLRARVTERIFEFKDALPTYYDSVLDHTIRDIESRENEISNSLYNKLTFKD